MKGKFIQSILFILFSFNLNAQKLKLQPSFTAITVANIDSSVKWYTETLKLTLRNRVDNAERGFKQAILINAETMIELVELNKGIPLDTILKNLPNGTQVNGFYKFGFTAENIDALFKELTVAKIKFYGKMVSDRISSKRTFIIEDPDKNLIQFFEK
jgi:catechol 2,3-dioxygenase-like lactoylglutathione lyase family enzyme